ncbi:MAG TPA: phospho-N-acetylmuramoyl-pentapeptide-transferase [Candidatus Absconditabacterales bacterium]|nr:phospho-N-acetylmuramoyl-pentapeptide-transferase [Candidatus Absconditabacterales bacterium]
MKLLLNSYSDQDIISSSHMLSKLNYIIICSLGAFLLTMVIYPSVISLLRKMKLGITNREESVTGDKAVIFNELHKKKNGTPTMGGIVFFIVMGIMIIGSWIGAKLGYINHTLISRSETYIILFAFFGMGCLGLIDDYIKLKGLTKSNGLGAKFKLIYMIGCALFISYWFNLKLGVNTIDLRPINYILNTGRQIIELGSMSFEFSIVYILITFFLTLSITNAINITDGLDGLMSGMMLIVLAIFGSITFWLGRYLATAVIGIVIGMLCGYLRFNINPAQIFMGDSGSLALGGLISTLVYLISIKIGFLIPFLILFGVFRLEVGSSMLQIFRKKVFKHKLFLIAPLHHLFEKLGYSETNIVMRFWLVQGAIGMTVLIMMVYQFIK